MDKDKKCNCNYAPTVLRLVLGLLLLVPGLSKLMQPDMIAGMLAGMGFPAAALLGWLVIIGEVLGGIAILAGFQFKYTIWAPLVIMVVATVAVSAPGLDMANPMTIISFLFHLVAVGGLVSLYLSGPGAISVDKMMK